MRLLILNPNTTEAVTRRVVAAGQQVAAAGTILLPATAPRGVPYIATRTEAVIGAAVALEMIAAREAEIDGAVVAAFGDPGLLAARELFDVPVVGMAEAAMLTACMLGRRFAIVTFATALASWYADCVEAHGMADRLASIRCLEEDPGPIEDVPERKGDLLAALAGRAVAEDGADAIILAGAPLAGMAPAVRDRVPVPVIDGAQAAVKQLEALVSLRPRKAEAGRFRRPGPKSSVGLDGALAAKIAGTERRP